MREGTTPGSAWRVTPQLLLGLIIIAVGVILTLDNLGILYADEFLKYWPVGLIALGALRLWHWRDGSGGGFPGLLFTIAGGWLLLDAIGMVDISVREAWPLVLIAIGAAVVWQGMRARSRVISADSNDTVSGFAMLGGFSRGNNSTSFKGGELTAVMGGLEIDLRQSRIEGEAVLNIFAMWGGIDIRVPDDWTVIVRVTPLLGGVEDKTRPPQGPAGQRLVIQGVVLMGGAEVRN